MKKKLNIYALSTSSGKSSISIIRISGPNAFLIANKFIKKQPEIRKATTTRIIYNKILIDIGIVTYYSFKNSYTGEDLVEFNLHGSVAVIKKMLEILSIQKNTRLALPGEFTRRAFENKKLQLSQVEGIYNLIESETESQRKLSLKLLDGDLGKKVKLWKKKLINVLSILDASIDFSEEDLPKSHLLEIQNEIKKLINHFKREIKGSYIAESLTDSFEVALIGKPNVGKSTLLNFLLKRDISIVTNIPGTTRDILEAKLDLKGLPVTFIDTAGLRKSNDKVEKIGIKKTLKKVSTVDLRVFLINKNSDLDSFKQIKRKNDLVFISKSDKRKLHNEMGISGVTGEGTDILINKIYDILSKKTLSVGSVVNSRHRLIIKNALSFLNDALLNCNSDFDKIELIAEDIKKTLKELDFLVGTIDVEDILENIFSKFCIGK